MTGEVKVYSQLGVDFMDYHTDKIGKINTSNIPVLPHAVHANHYLFSNDAQPVLTDPLYYNFSEYHTDMERLTKEQISKRMIVIKNFLFYPKSTIEAIMQSKISNFDMLDCVCIGNIIVYIRDTFCQQFSCSVNAGFWHQNCVGLPPGSQCSFGFDIISLHTYLLSFNKRQYSQSVEELYEYFSSRNFIQRSNSLYPKEFYVQEKNPISMYSPVF